MNRAHISWVHLLQLILSMSQTPHTSHKRARYEVSVSWVQSLPCFLTLSMLCCRECRADSRFVPSQWETLLQSNTVSHWLVANLESALEYCVILHHVIQRLDYLLSVSHGPTSRHYIQHRKLEPWSNFQLTKTPHTSPSQASYGVSIMIILAE